MQKKKLIDAKFTVREDIMSRLKEIEDELTELPPSLNTDVEKQIAFAKTVDAVQRELESVVKGEFITFDVSNENLANVRTKTAEFNEEHKQSLEEHKKLFHRPQFERDLEAAIRTRKGTLLPNFMDPKVVNTLIVKEIRSIMPSCERLVFRSAETFKDVLFSVIDRGFTRFPDLNQAIKAEIIRQVETRKKKTTKELTKMMRIEQEEPYTYNKRFN